MTEVKNGRANREIETTETKEWQKEANAIKHLHILVYSLTMFGAEKFVYLFT